MASKKVFFFKGFDFHHQDIKRHDARDNFCQQEGPGLDEVGINSPQDQSERIQDVHPQRDALCGLCATDFHHLGQKSKRGDKARRDAQSVNKIHEGDFPFALIVFDCGLIF